MDERSRAELLDHAASLERHVLDRMREVLGELPEGSQYREVLERHRRTLEEAIQQIEEIQAKGEGQLGETG
jgi:hemerythrin superfamily protein